MLTMRNQQLKALQAVATEQFVARLARTFRTEQPGLVAAYAEPELQQQLRQAVERAQSYGLVAEKDAFVFATVWLLYGTDFDQDPQHAWAREICKDQALTSRAKAMQLREAARKRSADGGENNG